MNIKNLSEKWVDQDLKPQMNTDKHRWEVIVKRLFG